MTYIDVQPHIQWKLKGLSHVEFARQSYLGGFFLVFPHRSVCGMLFSFCLRHFLIIAYFYLSTRATKHLRPVHLYMHDKENGFCKEKVSDYLLVY